MRFFVPFLLAAVALATSACDTGFGQPCDIPEDITACRGSRVDVDDAGIATEVSASCAITSYARCETQVCLSYRGHKSYCSEVCIEDSDCPGSARCRPILGGAASAEATEAESAVNPCIPTDAGATSECYCVKKKDL